MIDENYFILNVILLMIGTIAIRGLFIALASKMKITPDIKELFTFIPAAIFPALIVPTTFFHQGQSALLFGKERFLILLAASILCFFYRNTLVVISFGLVALFLISQI